MRFSFQPSRQLLWGLKECLLSENPLARLADSTMRWKLACVKTQSLTQRKNGHPTE